MKVVLDDQLFADAANTVTLVSFVQHGVSGRHVVEIEPMPTIVAEGQGNRWEWPAPVGAWLTAQSDQIRAEVEVCIESALNAEADQMPRRTVNVSAAGSQATFEDDVAWLPLPQALILMGMPLKIMVENVENDRDFLLAFAPDAHATALTNAETNHWIEFVHGGGLGDACNQAEALNSKHLERFRHFAVFDSDAASPQMPSANSIKMREACQAAKIAHHRLNRRAAENYLPMSALERWAHERIHIPQRERDVRKWRVAALRRLPDTHRHHYNFKGGYGTDDGMDWDLARHQARTSFLANLDPALVADLANGIDKHITNLYSHSEYTASRAWFFNEDSDREIAEIIREILSYQ